MKTTSRSSTSRGRLIVLKLLIFRRNCPHPSEEELWVVVT
jgi:hypothetical protein